MEAISVQENKVIILIYGECTRNVNDAVAVYADRFPYKQRFKSSFYRVVKQFFEDATLV